MRVCSHRLVSRFCITLDAQAWPTTIPPGLAFTDVALIYLRPCGERGLQVERQLDSWGPNGRYGLERLCGCHHRMQTLNASGEDVVLRRTTAVAWTLHDGFIRNNCPKWSQPDRTGDLLLAKPVLAARRKDAGFACQISWYLGSDQPVETAI